MRRTVGVGIARVLPRGGPGGEDSVDVDIEITLSAPADLSYANAPFSFTGGVQIADQFPSVTGNVETYSVLPPLPDGLSLDPDTGVIGGTPTTDQGATSYAVTATNATGSATVDISITIVSTYCPGETVGGHCWYYGSANQSCTQVCATRGGYDQAGTRDFAGSAGTNANCQAVLQALGEDDDNGAVETIAGAFGCASDWSDISNWVRYTTATTEGASGTNIHRACACNFIPVPAAPTGLAYSGAPFTFNQLIAIAPQTPSVTGKMLTFSISPPLPSGLSFDTATGQISGTPNSAQAATNYTVTATNAGGSDDVVISIQVVVPAPSNLSYANAPFGFFVGSDIPDISAHVRYTSTTTCAASAHGGPFIHRACACAE